MAATAGTVELRYAGFRRRIIVVMIDLVIVLVVPAS